MIPGEVTGPEGTLVLNEGAVAVAVVVINIADRPVQVGSHYHFAEANPGLSFDRDAAYGRRLDIPAPLGRYWPAGFSHGVTARSNQP